MFHACAKTARFNWIIFWLACLSGCIYLIPAYLISQSVPLGLIVALLIVLSGLLMGSLFPLDSPYRID